jgi:hypothetical protein
MKGAVCYRQQAHWVRRCSQSDRRVTNTDSILWARRNANGHRMECVVRFAPGGVQVGILSEGSPIVSRVFPNGAEAVARAAEERAHCEHDGG